VVHQHYESEADANRSEELKKVDDISIEKESDLNISLKKISDDARKSS
jgi:hypothetical protein